jgi:tRNA(fMet)-specific endonuclease VapC
VLDRFSAFPVRDIGISSITLAELDYGAAKSAQPKKNREALEEFVSPLDVAAFDRDAAEAYGRIRSTREKKGLPIGAMDMLIAAHALSGASLVTNNELNSAEYLGFVWKTGPKKLHLFSFFVPNFPVSQRCPCHLILLDNEIGLLQPTK